MRRGASTVACVVRWTARLTSLASATLVVMAAATPGAPPSPSEAVGLLLFPVGVIVGFAVAWWREGPGGLVSVASLAAFYGWMVLVDGSVPRGPYFVILASPAILFLWSWWLSGPEHRGGAAVHAA